MKELIKLIYESLPALHEGDSITITKHEGNTFVFSVHSDYETMDLREIEIRA